MAYLKNRLFDLPEAAEIAGCGERDLLELGATGQIPLHAYVEHKYVDWCTYDGEHLQPQGGQEEAGYFALEREAILRIERKGHVNDPWVVQWGSDPTYHGCVWRGPGGPWSVGRADLRVSKDDLERVLRREVGVWEMPAALTGKSKRELQKALTKKRDDWIYKR